MEYFIFNPDTSGKIIMQELVQAAKRGVKVRILVDKSGAVFKLDEFYAKVLKENNIDVKYYNPSPAVMISSVQFRNHRKLIVRDGEEAITGGRNIADEYFNLSTKFNFLDRDASIEGGAVKPMLETFDRFWNSKLVETPKVIEPPIKLTAETRNMGKDENYYKVSVKDFESRTKSANEVLVQTQEQKKVLNFLETTAKAALEKNKKYNCPEVAFATDREGGSFKERIHSDNYNENYRQLRKEIAKWMDNKVKDEVILDSPYFLENSKSRRIADNLLASNKKITIFTNSLGSTDAIYVSTVFADTVRNYTPNDNFSATVYKGSFSGESELYSDEVRNSTWGTHSKTIVFNNDSFMIGTFNIDNRSNFYNTEMAIFCSGSPELTKDVKDNIALRMKNGYHLNHEGKPDDCSPLLSGATPMKKALYYLIKVPSHLLQFLL
jgi:putative cardiolipin synthase